tara:strand:- start:851 stop:1225 length:375 start_codon:yes stop_codon:yes gene_type:complete
MPKKRLSELAKEYGITFEEIHKIATYHLDEHMITGNGKNLWMGEDGQRLIDDLIPMTTIYRGVVISQAPNKRFVMTRIKELGKKVPVSIPLALSGKLEGKVIHIEADNSQEETKYKWIKAPVRQ